MEPTKAQNQKQPYESPKITRVTLSHDQAILSGCSTSTTRVNATTNSFCRRGCRAGGSNNSDSTGNS